MRWQRRARFGVAIFGIACAIAVYLAIGERQVSVPLAPPERLDPTAVLESVGAQVEQDRGMEQDYQIASERQLVYEDGRTRLLGVQIRVRNRAGRDFTLSGGQAEAGEGQKQLLLQQRVQLDASDGFQLHAERASFSEDDEVVRAPGDVRFNKGALAGSGVDLTYDQRNDNVTLHDGARIIMAGDGAEAPPAMEFSAGTAVLDRTRDSLTLERDVHVYRRGEVFVADRAVARMTPDEDAVTYLELRGHARVETEGGALESMSARDIDLDYTEDGETLERVILSGTAAVVLGGAGGAPGRQMAGDTLDLLLAADGSLTHAIGGGGVQLVMPAGAAGGGQVIAARALDATGDPGGGLTAVQFTDDVMFREEAARRGAEGRVARARALRIALRDDTIESAVFTGGVRFDDAGLRASGADARYRPDASTLRLTGTDAGGGPRVADERITIEARVIDVQLGSRRMTADGTVRATLRPGSGGSRLPGLLDAARPANVKAEELQYDGADGAITFRGSAELWQAEATAVRGDVILIDQAKGDLRVDGAARSDILLGAERSIGRAAGIAYEDRTRTITYAAPAAAPGAAPGELAQVSGPQGDVRAERLEVVLAARGGEAERLEAYRRVSARIASRTATGDRLSYFAADGRYVMTATGTRPVRVVDGCRESSGKTLTFFKGTDRIVVDGNEEIRTQTTSGGPCAAPPPAAR